MEDPILDKLKSSRPNRKLERKIDSSSDNLIRSSLKSQRRVVAQPPSPVTPIVSPEPLPIYTAPDPVTHVKGNVIDTGEAYTDSVKLVKQKLRKDALRIHSIIEQVQKGEILVVRGAHDHIENILASSNIPYQELNSEKYLKDAQVVFVNCSLEHNVDYSALEKFVSNGGFLVSTDWTLLNLVSKRFGNVKYTRVNTENDVVEVTVTDPANFYVGNAFPKGIKPSWWLESSSYCIEITNPENVNVLIRSDELKEKYGSDVIGVTFRHGNGRVFHFISHFCLQQSKEYLDPSKKSSESFAKDILDLDDQEIDSLGINKRQSYGAVETAYSSAMIIHNIIAAKKSRYNGN